MFESVDARTDARTDGRTDARTHRRRLESHPISSPGELKTGRQPRQRYSYRKPTRSVTRFVVVELVFYVPSTQFRSFGMQSVNLATLFLGKPRHFTST